MQFYSDEKWVKVYFPQTLARKFLFQAAVRTFIGFLFKWRPTHENPLKRL